jgi:exonuclease III
MASPRRSKKSSLPLPEINIPYQDFKTRFEKTPPEEQFQVVTWQVNNIKHLIKHPKSKDKDSEDELPIRMFIKDHDYPAIVCLQDIRIHRLDEEMKDDVRRAVNEGEGLQYEVFFSLRGARHMDYELRENAKYEFTQERHQPKNEISGIWYGVCTLVREDYVEYLQIEEGAGQPEWDVWGRFNILKLITPDWKLAVFNCFFPDVARRGSKKTRALAFTGARFDDIEAATDPDSKEVSKEFTDRWFNTARDAYLPQDREQLEAEGYPDVVIRDMGTTTKDDHYFRAQLHKRVVREARECAKNGFHILLIGSMNISPRDWDHIAVKRRPQGFKPEKDHVINRMDFEHKFLSQGHQQYLRGFDAWKLVNTRKEPNIHYAIISHNLGESKALLYAQVLDKVKQTDAAYYDVNDITVSKNVVFHLPSLAAAEPENDFPQSDNEDTEDEVIKEEEEHYEDEDAEGEDYDEEEEGSEE